MPSTSISLHPAADKSVSIDRLEFRSPYYVNPPDKLKGAAALLSDIQRCVNRIDIFENIFSPALTGQIYVRDVESLTNLTRMVGLDQVYLQFSMVDKRTNTPKVFGPHPFAVYSQSNRSPAGQGVEEYVLGIASPELILSMARKFSQSYYMKPEDIIKNIVESAYGLNSTKSFKERQATKSIMKLVVPYMRPLDAIRLVTLQGQTETNLTNFLFFETLEGYHYTSFQRLLELAEEDTEIPTIYVELSGQREIGNTPTRIKAEQLQVVSGFDMLYAMERGFFSSVTIAPDVLSGVCGVEISGTGLGTAYDSRKKVNPQGIDIYPEWVGQSTPPTSRIFLVPTTQFSAANTSLRKEDPSITDNFIAQTLSGRNRELLGLQSRTIRGRVAGAPNLHVGKFIDVLFPTTLNNNNIAGPELRDVASGRYIIFNAQHSIIADGRGKFFYETTFEAVTDSFAKV